MKSSTSSRFVGGQMPWDQDAGSLQCLPPSPSPWMTILCLLHFHPQHQLLPCVSVQEHPTQTEGLCDPHNEWALPARGYMCSTIDPCVQRFFPAKGTKLCYTHMHTWREVGKRSDRALPLNIHTTVLERDKSLSFIRKSEVARSFIKLRANDGTHGISSPFMPATPSPLLLFQASMSFSLPLAPDLNLYHPLIWPNDKLKAGTLERRTTAWRAWCLLPMESLALSTIWGGGKGADKVWTPYSLTSRGAVLTVLK